MSKYRKFLGDRNCVFTSSNNHQHNSMSSQSNRNWASTTPGKFLSSLLYLRSKPLVFLQALLNIQLLQNVWEGMRFGCSGLSVRERVPDSPRLHKQHLANGHLKLSTLSASLGSGSVMQEGGTSPSAQVAAVLLWRLWLIAGSCKVYLGVIHTNFGALLSYALGKMPCLVHKLLSLVQLCAQTGFKMQACAEGDNKLPQEKEIAKVASCG